MPKNLEQARQLLSRVKPWVAIAAVFAAALLGVYGLQGWDYWEARSELETNTLEIERLSQKLAVTIPELETLNAERALEDAKLDEYRRLFTYPDIGNLMTLVSLTAAETNVSLPTLSVGESRAKVIDDIEFQTHSLSLTATGNTETIFLFLTELHRKIPIVSIPSVTITDPNTATSAAQVQLIFYVSPEAVADEQGAD